ncbi:hypothetical protein V6Z12_A13G112500 [Gossypium hirsutum]
MIRLLLWCFENPLKSIGEGFLLLPLLQGIIQVVDLMRMRFH